MYSNSVIVFALNLSFARRIIVHGLGKIMLVCYKNSYKEYL